MKDFVDCGPGYDVVYVYGPDVLENCEVNDRVYLQPLADQSSIDRLKRGLSSDKDFPGDKILDGTTTVISNESIVNDETVDNSTCNSANEQSNSISSDKGDNNNSKNGDNSDDQTNEDTDDEGNDDTDDEGN